MKESLRPLEAEFDEVDTLLKEINEEIRVNKR